MTPSSCESMADTPWSDLVPQANLCDHLFLAVSRSLTALVQQSPSVLPRTSLPRFDFDLAGRGQPDQQPKDWDRTKLDFVSTVTFQELHVCGFYLACHRRPLTDSSMNVYSPDTIRTNHPQALP